MRYTELHDNLLQTTPTLNAAVHVAEVPQSWHKYVVQARREAELLRLRLIAYDQSASTRTTKRKSEINLG